MDIALMTNIINQSIFVGIKFPFECNRQFHDTKIRSQMTASLRNMIDDKFP